MTIATQYTQEITCPGCGHEQSDSWEHDSDGEHVCDDCGLAYSHTREVTVEYCTGPTCPKCKGGDAPMLKPLDENRWRCWRCKGVFEIHRHADRVDVTQIGGAP